MRIGQDRGLLLCNDSKAPTVLQSCSGVYSCQATGHTCLDDSVCTMPASSFLAAALGPWHSALQLPETPHALHPLHNSHMRPQDDILSGLILLVSEARSCVHGKHVNWSKLRQLWATAASSHCGSLYHDVAAMTSIAAIRGLELSCSQ